MRLEEVRGWKKAERPESQCVLAGTCQMKARVKLFQKFRVNHKFPKISVFRAT